MRVNNRELGPSTQILVLPREGFDIVFKAKAVLDHSEFNALCPEPIPPGISRPGQPDSVDLQNPGYLAARHKRNQYLNSWVILKTLEPTDGLVWDKVIANDPETWKLYDEEFKAAGFNIGEVNAIIRLVTDVNGADDAKLKEAKNRFLAGTLEVKPQNSLLDAQ